MKIEFEAKFFDVDIEQLRTKLSKCGALLTSEKKLLRRKIFDFSNKDIHKQWIRVRDEGNKINVTLKKVANPAKIDGTYELEFGVDNFDKTCDFLTACGIIPKAYQENYRESWIYQEGLITIDTWPGLAPFVEIEANNEEQVRFMSKLLDFDFDKAYFGTVDKIYERVLGIPADIFNQIGELTFDNFNEIIKSLKLEYNANQ